MINLTLNEYNGRIESGVHAIPIGNPFTVSILTDRDHEINISNLKKNLKKPLGNIMSLTRTQMHILAQGRSWNAAVRVTRKK